MESIDLGVFRKILTKIGDSCIFTYPISQAKVSLKRVNMAVNQFIFGSNIRALMSSW